MTTTERALRAAWPSDGAVLSDRRGSDGRLLRRIESHPSSGHLLAASGWGLYRISADAALIECAPVGDTAWLWQRFLIGQVLPFAAVVRGYEVFHASAVARGSRAVALVGATQQGKSTLASELLRRGWEFVADDVVVAEVVDGSVIIHPGMGLISIRSGAKAGDRPLDHVGTEIGRDDEAVRLAVPVSPGARTLAAVYLLDRRADPGSASVERLRPLDPRLLLAATFNLVVQTPARLIRQLDVCARIAATAKVSRVTVNEGSTPADVAELLIQDAGDL